MLAKILVRGWIRVKTTWQSTVMPFINRIKLRGMGVQFGKNCIVRSSFSLRVGRTANVEIGDNFRITGSNLANPLCKNQSCINVAEGAKMIIGNNVGMSSPTIYVHESLVIGNYVNLGGGITILDSDCHSLNYLDRRVGTVDQKNKKNKPIEIDDDVLIGSYSIILKGVHIGARSVIGAGSVVTKDIPADCIAAGNPCRVIKQLDNNSRKN